MYRLQRNGISGCDYNTTTHIHTINYSYRMTSMNQMGPTPNQILGSHATKENFESRYHSINNCQKDKRQTHSLTPYPNHTRPHTKITCQHIDNDIQ